MHGWRIDRALHNYIYFTWYDPYVSYFLKAGRLVVDKFAAMPLLAPAFQMVFNRYHAKVITADDAVKILTLNESLNLGPDTTERVIPFPYANQIILQEPDYIAVMDCPCRLSRENPCQPVNVCLAVGQTTASFWLEHGARFHARKVSQEEALNLIKQERKKGRITTAWFKVATGGRTGVICSCCPCCCGGIEAMRLARRVKGGEKLINLIPSGYKAELVPEKCAACGKCVDLCAFEAIAKDPEGDPVFDSSRCMGCGICVELCPNAARRLVPAEDGTLPLDLDLLREKLAH